ncbi:MAG: hypothetical protein WBP41_02160 [Saprospiraceae bacterium]
MKILYKNKFLVLILLLMVTVTIFMAQVTDKGVQKRGSSYSPVVEESFDKVMANDKAQKDGIMKRQLDLLNARV